ADAILDAAAEVDGGGLGKILGGAAHFPDGEMIPKDLGQHLVVEDKVIGVGLQGQALEELAGEGAVAGVVLGELGPEEQVLRGSEEAIGDVLPDGHAALQSIATKDAAAEDAVVK